MAKVVWREKASLLLEEHLDYALNEFGRKAVSNWYKDILRIESRMALNPLPQNRCSLTEERRIAEQ